MIERYLNPNVNISNIDTRISKICKKTPYKYYTMLNKCDTYKCVKLKDFAILKRVHVYTCTIFCKFAFLQK